MGRSFCKQISPFWLDNRDVQGRNDVRWRLGQETSLAPPCSNLRSFGSKCTILKICAYDSVVTFCPPQWFGARGIVAPCPPSLRLCCYAIKIGKFFRKQTNFQVRTSWTSIPWTSAISNTIRHGSCADCQQRLFLCHFYACPTRFFGVDLCLFR